MPTFKQIEIGGDESSCDEDRFSQVSDLFASNNLTINSAIARGQSATDIVAVVLASASRQEEPSPKFASQPKTPKCNILVGDATLPPGKCARMVVSVTSRSLASLLCVDGKEGLGVFTPMKNNSDDGIEHVFALGMLQPGDVVRFNNVEVHKNYESDSTALSNPRKRKQESSSKDEIGQTTPLLTVTCDLRTSWKVPCAGPPLARICRIIPTSATIETPDFHLQWERNVPMSFETSKDVVTELARYYCKDARPRHFSNPTLVLPTTQACKRRRIRDISTANIVSHVLVKVLRCERATSLFVTPSKKSSTEPRITHATLADGKENDDMIGIAASVGLARVAGNTPVLPRAISTTLLQAMTEGKYVLLTNVSSQSVNPVATGKEYLGLVPTMETTATIITPEHPYMPEMSQHRDKDPHASQPLTLERASQLLSLTQHDSPEKKDTRCLMAIVASLKDIFVDGISASFVEGAYWERPRALSNFLIHRPSISTGLDAIKLRPSYRSATLLLDPKVVSREISVNAVGSALKLLCMDVPIEDMIIDDDCIDASTHPYLLHVGRMLKSLCEEDVRIRWVLEQEDECNWFVTNATLLEI